MEIGFYSHVNTKPLATTACIQSVRKFYPNNKIVISCDAAYDYSEICSRYKVVYHHNYVALGYPVQPFGYRKDKVIEWLDRMYHAVVLMSKTDYFVMLEDDVLIHNPITINPEWEMAGDRKSTRLNSSHT